MGLRDAIPQGMNDFSCRPSAAHPRPVLLVNGTFENSYANWAMYSPQLKADGHCETVLAATGADRVDIVGHSQGGLVPLYHINRLGGESKVQDFCPEDQTNHGTMVYDDITLRLVRNILDRATAVAPACHAVAPLPWIMDRHRNLDRH
ncbi:hypothetical protein FXW78_37585 [Rhodococcus opacus]|nr:hypothetical protein [Rhodococcus opacus]